MAREIISPWIKEMDENLIGEPVVETSCTDVAIIGGGIAGTSTTYYILEGTDLRVTLLERDKVGYGASGRNGGQGIASVERSFQDMLGSLDGPAIAAMLNDIELGHKRVEEICHELNYRDGLFKTTVWTGLSSLSEVQDQIEEMHLRAKYDAPVRPLWIEEGVIEKVSIYPELAPLISTETTAWLKETLHTKEDYIAAYPAPVSLANSGRLSRSIARYLLAQHPDRFALHEMSPVSKIVCTDGVTVHALGTTINARTAVLCTNGYTLPSFESRDRPKVIDSLRRYVASMVGHSSEEDQPPGAFIYYHDEGDPEEEPYFYLTRRPFLLDGKNLVTVGGPQQTLTGEMDDRSEYPQGIYDRIEGFLARSYAEPLTSKDAMCWNGPMGYTMDGIRLIGPDPLVKGLWYNTACNGVGFLPSIVGGKKVAEQLEKANDDAQRELH